ncbi:oligopeptide ABC superfamily ATP binding cassette transporter, ABC protein [Sporosarcina newyorkensis 2681]|uniref:Oligopeptide ABC superfamily ATP binding cassette transporter, ABC protein n=1 Tax=Sporosarcina newyorkensis 2681 TaxID=1027292 RepID=F9DS94_9BACL|nr:ABC transporter ATP-binding protein [Sporosarcina newyorkensis]EGQ26394.1 oligopeptide ABC superfamily ATP binding cassette transporter, ABC protein [Sporosarcina newyorkensis 2681]
MSENLLSIEDLDVEFRSSSSTVKAVNGVNLTLKKKETLGIVGESGSGKSVTATALMQLIPSPPGKISNGKILFNGIDLLTLSKKEMRSIRGNEIAMIFQDPMTSLNPVFTVGNQIIEAIRQHKKISKKEARLEAVAMLKTVGIPEPEKRIDMYPHEFSGGMRQRAMIAIALSCNPKLLIADEPTTALDVTVQAQILELMKDLQQTNDTAIIMITHDLGVVWEMCDNIIVMYAGTTVESGSVETIFKNPLHPYTWGLLESQITTDVQHNEKLPAIPGSPPDLRKPVLGCPFVDRCPYSEEVCHTKKPEYIEVEPGHFAACHFQHETSRLEKKEGMFVD